MINWLARTTLYVILWPFLALGRKISEYRSNRWWDKQAEKNKHLWKPIPTVKDEE